MEYWRCITYQVLLFTYGGLRRIWLDIGYMHLVGRSFFWPVTPATAVWGRFGHEEGEVGYELCNFARRSTGGVLVLLWCLYEYENAGTAAVFVWNVLKFADRDTKNGILFLGCRFLGTLGKFRWILQMLSIIIPWVVFVFFGKFIYEPW